MTDRLLGGDLPEKRRCKLAPGMLEQPPDLPISIMRSAGRRRLDVTPDPLDPTRPQISVVVSRLIRLREGVAPIRRILIFDDHAATIRLLDDVDLAQTRQNKLALVECSALIVLLMLAVFWPLL